MSRYVAKPDRELVVVLRHPHALLDDKRHGLAVERQQAFPLRYCRDEARVGALVLGRAVDAACRSRP